MLTFLVVYHAGAVLWSVGWLFYIMRATALCTSDGIAVLIVAVLPWLPHIWVLGGLARAARKVTVVSAMAVSWIVDTLK